MDPCLREEFNNVPLEREVMGNLLDKEEVRWCGAETGCLTERGDQGLDQNTRAQQCDHPEGRGHASGASALGPEQEWQAGMRRGEAPSLGVADDFTFEGVFSGDVMSPGARRHGDSSSVEDRGGDREEFGTGILYKIRRNGQMEVVAFVKDSDAYNCGFIQDGDQLNSVDSVPISVMTWSQLRTALGGTRGSTVSSVTSQNSKTTEELPTGRGIAHICTLRMIVSPSLPPSNFRAARLGCPQVFEAVEWQGDDPRNKPRQGLCEDHQDRQFGSQPDVRPFFPPSFPHNFLIFSTFSLLQIFSGEEECRVSNKGGRREPVEEQRDAILGGMHRILLLLIAPRLMNFIEQRRCTKLLSNSFDT